MTMTSMITEGAVSSVGWAAGGRKSHDADEFLHGVYERLSDYVHEQAVNHKTIELPARGFEEAIPLGLYHLFDRVGFPVKILDDGVVPI